MTEHGVQFFPEASPGSGRGYQNFDRRGAPQSTVRTSWVSSLEAFSCYPTPGRFRAMAFRPTRVAGQVRPWFLSY